MLICACVVIMQGLELGIDRFDIQTVKLAGISCFLELPLILIQYSFLIIFTADALFSVGLLHDVGHGPFSHLFERQFLPQVISGCDW